MRSTNRVVGVSINTVKALLIEAGEACREFHDTTVREVQTARVQCDELWSFCYAKAVGDGGGRSPMGRRCVDELPWLMSRGFLSWLVSPSRYRPAT